MRYGFLLLALLTLIPAGLVMLLRRDLRPVVVRVAVLSLPFALTERLFYPDYWEPTFLFELADRVGFGVEDLLFVAGLGGFSSTVYALACRRGYESRAQTAGGDVVRRAAAVFAGVALSVLLALIAGVPMIFAAPVIMLGLSALVAVRRRDLVLPSFVGGGLTLLVYGAILSLFSLAFPLAFERQWHTDRLSGCFVVGIPLEELIYGFACGVAATALYPYLWAKRFVGLGAEPGA